MDNVYFAVAGVGMIVVGAVGIVGFVLFFLGALMKFVVAPYLGPLFDRLGTGARSWLSPPGSGDVAVARTSSRPRS